MTMTNQQLDEAIAAAQAEVDRLKGIKNTRVALGMVGGDATTSIGKWKYDSRGLLAEGWVQGSFSRIDPVVDGSCPSAVYLERTGHYLSMPRTDLGEKFPAYAERVSAQAGVQGRPQNIGALFLSVAKHFERFGGYKERGENWPLVADYYFNRYAYLSDEERAQYDRDRAGWDRQHQRMQGQVQ